MFSRRRFLASLSCALPGALWSAQAPNPRGIPLQLEPLAFPIDALEPFLNAETLRAHHDVYHAQCLTDLHHALDRIHLPVGNVVTLMPTMNELIEMPDYNRSTLTLGRQIGRAAPQAVVDVIRKHGGAHVNHTAFWRFLAPPGSGPSGPSADARKAIQRDFGSIKNFKTAFTEAALNHYGAGWAWLSYRRDGTLFVSTTHNEDNPFMTDHVPSHEQGRPILCLDLWEHAYHDQYAFDRERYVDAWWNVVNWKFVDRAYAVVTAIR